MYFHLKQNKNDIKIMRLNKLEIYEPKQTLFTKLYIE